MNSVDCTLCENDFGRYAVPLSSRHRPVAQAVLRGDAWERQTIEFMRANAGNRDIVHAGAYFGDFLPGLSSALGPEKTIYAFEPNSENFNCAEWTKVLNALSNVHLQRAGLGEVNGSKTIWITEFGSALGGGSYISAAQGTPEGCNEQSEDISVVRLDDVLPADSDIGIIHLDIEGCEEAALKGGINTISRCRPILILEFVPHAFIDSRMVPLGYRHVDTVCGNEIFRA